MEPSDTPAAPREDTAPSAKSRFARIGIVIGVLAAALVAFFVLGLDAFLTIEALAENRAWLLEQVGDQRWLVALIFVAIYAAAVAVSVPGAAILTIAGGFLFGVVQGTIFAVVGATLGAIGLFLFVRIGLGDSLRSRAGSGIDKLRQGFQENALGYLLFLRLLPIVPFWLVNLAAALLRVPLRTFAIATAVGIIPGSLVYTSFGNGIGALIEAGQDVNLESILTAEIVLPLVGLALLALAPIVYKKIRGQRAKGAA
ncbi:TVP38/TMEM64 family protein [Bauldia sp.]|uniref:TVP38/TMEM64 family protein n=1 Tax=Bauldia sp. TaxID=2575872 RepID=UPI003BAA5218